MRVICDKQLQYDLLIERLFAYSPLLEFVEQRRMEYEPIDSNLLPRLSTIWLGEWNGIFFSILLFNLNDKKYFLLYSSIVLKVLIYTLLFYLLSCSFFVKQSWIYIFISKFCRDLWDEIKISWAGAYKNHDIMISDLIISLESAFGLIFSFQRNFLAATTSEEFPFVEAFRFI